MREALSVMQALAACGGLLYAFLTRFFHIYVVRHTYVVVVCELVFCLAMHSPPES